MDIFLRILIAHIITDFLIQPDKWVADKKENTWKSKSLYLHVFLTGLMAWIFLAEWNLWYIALGIAVSHYLIDVLKLIFCDDGVLSYTFDQICHIFILAIVAIYLTNSLESTFETINTLTETKWLATIAGYLAMTTPVGYLVGKATKKWRNDLESDIEKRDSLEDAGIWIGILERVLVLTFVLFNQLQAIGFLIAAKSILRFSDKSEYNPRKQTEYVLIGTLISFTMALFIGLMIKILAT